jgi:pSer/pThr/pTyr-binding forkhead associated (FHA) protein
VIDIGIPKIMLTPDNAALRVGAEGKVFRLDRMRLVAGRSDPPFVSVDIDLRECQTGSPPMVSRRHAEILWVNGDLQIVDLGSRHGTFVDGQRLGAPTAGEPSAPASLKFGSKIKLGDVELELIQA